MSALEQAGIQLPEAAQEDVAALQSAAGHTAVIEQALSVLESSENAGVRAPPSDSATAAASSGAPPSDAASAPPRLSFACVLERHYSMALESTLQAAGLDDEEIAFVNCVEPTEEDVVSGLPLADRHWAAQHVSEWRRAAGREGPVLVFQSDVNLSAACGSVLKPLVAAAEEMSTPLVAAPEERVLLMYLGAAGPAAAAEQAGGAQAGAPCAEVGEHALLAVQSACLTRTCSGRRRRGDCSRRCR